jgi:D-alanyl-D-alanine carboxypeptidase
MISGMKRLPFSGFLFILLVCSLASGCADDAKRNAAQPQTETPPAFLHPAFNLTRESLAGLIGELPSGIWEAILAQPAEFLSLMQAIMEEPEGLLVLVDKKHPLPEGWEPHDLVDLKDYPLRLSRQNLQLRAIVMPALLEMAQAAKNDGVELLVSSAYRSAEYQKTVYQRIVHELGQAAADRESARPRHSQHQLGTVIDFGSIGDDFTGTKMERWLDANAWKYGFSLSFPEGEEALTGYRWESWHFRYIGKPAAEMEKRFFGGVQQRMLEYLSFRGKYFAAARIPP